MSIYRRTPWPHALVIWAVVLAGCGAELTTLTTEPTETSPQPAATLTPIGTPTAVPTPGVAAGKIAFESDRDGNWEIYIMNGDGSGVTNLTQNAADDNSPVWSPDGTRIGFISSRDGNREIYAMNADGSGVTNLTQNEANDAGPAWSPDGTRLAFASSRSGKADIYLMNADGSGVTWVAEDRGMQFPSVRADFAWSPDGTRIAFVSGPHIYLMSTDASSQTSLTENLVEAENQGPDWSPDGTRLLFTSTDTEGRDRIFVTNADGSGQTNLTGQAGEHWADWEPVWSPDGARIAFAAVRNDNFEIYVMNADGSGVIKLTDSGPDVENRMPVWSPDGTHIAFVSGLYGEYDIYVMNADGSGTTNLTQHVGGDWRPVWAP